MIDRITHWIAGADHTAAVGRSSEVFDPATGQVTGRVDLVAPEIVDDAVRAAVEAGDAWRRLSLSRRGKVLFAFRQLPDERKEELAAITTAEHGKVLDDALGEVTRGLEVVEFA